MTDPLLHLLDELPAGSLDPTRAARVRERCHAALARERRRAVRERDHGRPAPPNNEAGLARIWAPIVGSIGGVYLAEVLHEVLGMYGVL